MAQSRAVRFGVLVLLVVTLANPGAAMANGVAQPPSDVYDLLEDPEVVGVGQEAPHAELVPYADARQARADLGSGESRSKEWRSKESPWTASLDGQWRFHMSQRPEDVPDGFFEDGYDMSAPGWRAVDVPHTWQTDGLDHPMFRNVPTEMYPDDPPKVSHDVNPTGAYVRSFRLPADWDGRESFLRFEGVTSGYLVWVNGTYVGYDQGGYVPAEFDISEHLRQGENTVAVQVHRWSAGSHLEDYDQWRYSGIFRSVELYSTPKTYLQDVTIRTDLDARYENADLTAKVDATDKGNASGPREVVGTLYDPRGVKVMEMSERVDVGGDTGSVKLRGRVDDPAKWTDETPNLYRLVVKLHDADGRVSHVTAQPVGFREIEVRDRQVLVNGERILVKGVNRSETDPDTGRHSTRERVDSDIALMKRLNVNSIRTSHYPSDPYLYEKADEQGLWIDDEMEVETHHHENCPDDCLADLPEWQAAFMDRFVGMYERDKNHPSVFMWDTGNEAGLGEAHHSMAQFLDRNDRSRPVYHQSNSPNGDAPFADVAGPRYPSPDELDSMAKTAEKPIIMGEYAHAMGNSLGNFEEFWDVMRKYPQAQGGYIWDWAEQNIRQPLVTTPDSSGNDILTYLAGMPRHVDGPSGRALEFSGLDDYVEVYRDPKLDAVRDAVTVQARVRPDDWTGDFTVLAKGDHSYALKMADRNTLEFSVYGADGAWHQARADVPADWYGTWHRISGSFDGERITLVIDGMKVASTRWAGRVAYSAQPVNIGRNPETGTENIQTRMAHGAIDQVRLYYGGTQPVLALDFETLTEKGSFLSYGAGPSGVDGLVASDRTVQPEARAMAAVHAPIRISAATPEAGRIVVRNERSFTGTEDLELRWRVAEAGRTLAEGARSVALDPGQSKQIRLPAPPPNPEDADRRLTVEAVVERSGHTVAVEQFDIGGRQLGGVALAKPPGPIDVDRADGRITVSGRGFSYVFDSERGDLISMRSGSRELLSTGPELDAWRPPTSNEMGSEETQWRAAGLDRLKTTTGKVDLDVRHDEAVVAVPSTIAAPGVNDSKFLQTLRYTVSGTGEIRIDQRVEATGSARGMDYLPRVGLALRMPYLYDRFTWYGRGPHETYSDRTQGAPVDVYSTDVDAQFVEYTKPQEYGNHEDVRWASLSDGRNGLLVSGDLSVGVNPYTEMDRAAYPFALERDPLGTTLRLDHAVSGVGETFHPVLPEYQVPADREYAGSVLLRPLTRSEASTGRPAGPVVCTPETTLKAAEKSLAEKESTAATLTVTNPCQTTLTKATADFGLPSGWTAEPSSIDLGDLAPGESADVPLTITRGSGTRNGQRPILANVTSTAEPYGARTRDQGSVDILAVPPPPTGDTPVSGLEFVTADNGWGPVERDTSNGEQQPGDGKTITIGGTTYERGLGVHAKSVVEVYLGGNCSSFTADIGLDDEAGSGGTVTFEVYADSTLVYDSGRLTNADTAVPVSAEVDGAEMLALHVEDAGDGNGLDHADWAAANLHCTTP